MWIVLHASTEDVRRPPPGGLAGAVRESGSGGVETDPLAGATQGVVALEELLPPVSGT